MTTNERIAVRAGLLKAGLRRVSYDGPNRGAYSEQWRNAHGDTVCLSWAFREEPNPACCRGNRATECDGTCTDTTKCTKPL